MKPHKMTAPLIDEIEDKLFLKWSSEQISCWLLVNQNTCISHESIYRYVWADKAAGGDLYKHLRRQARSYKARGSNGKTRRGQIKNRISIDERPLSVDEKSRVGDWEIDTVIGKGHCSGALVTIVERVTLFTVSKRVKRKRAKEVTAATLALLMPFKGLVHTITSDNGKEFAYHEEIASGAGMRLLFCASVPFLGARTERKHEWSVTPILSEKYRL